MENDNAEMKPSDSKMENEISKLKDEVSEIIRINKESSNNFVMETKELKDENRRMEKEINSLANNVTENKELINANQKEIRENKNTWKVSNKLDT